jgi:hypothetical protein
MRKLTLLGICGILALTGATQAVRASVPPTIAFQGYLTDPGGAPVNGTVSLVCAIYSQPTGGASSWSETHPSVSVANGIFAVALGAVTPFPAGLFDDAPRHLGIRVNGEAEMPRTELRSAPFAFGAGTAGTAQTLTGNIDITIGGEPALETSTTAGGLLLEFHDVVGGYPSVIFGTSTPGSGLLRLYETLDTGSGTLKVDLDASRDGDASVRVPGDAISALEMLNEPGIACNNNTGTMELTGPIQVLVSRTITPPGNGYILAIGQTSTRITHTVGTGTSCIVGLSDDGTSYAYAQDMNIQISSQAPSGQYSIPVGLNSVFAASADVPLTVYIVAEELSGYVLLEDFSLTLLYVPTAYGTVDLALARGDGSDSDASDALGAPMTQSEIDAERTESQRWNAERIQREITEMRDQIAEMQRRMEEERRGSGRSTTSPTASGGR